MNALTAYHGVRLNVRNHVMDILLAALGFIHREEIVRGSKKKMTHLETSTPSVAAPIHPGTDVYSSVSGFYSSGDVSFFGAASIPPGTSTSPAVASIPPRTSPSRAEASPKRYRWDPMHEHAIRDIRHKRASLRYKDLMYEAKYQELKANAEHLHIMTYSPIPTDEQLMFEAGSGSNKGHVCGFSSQSAAITVESQGGSSSS
ncbi:hypothetical protein M9H77_12297 [Catharanthus roseus]|uniref:Uncharacterized protein n=1 Tax=Catharanthus roseus TaxID=4058 RepID=A0ACC0BH68_CATRO|nr:hypothetical protein M9H77_12297 [Catharanthus roseus]